MQYNPNSWHERKECTNTFAWWIIGVLERLEHQQLEWGNPSSNTVLLCRAMGMFVYSTLLQFTYLCECITVVDICVRVFLCTYCSVTRCFREKSTWCSADYVKWKVFWAVLSIEYCAIFSNNLFPELFSGHIVTSVCVDLYQDTIYFI